MIMTETRDLSALVEKIRKRIGISNGPVVRRIEAGALIKFAKATGETNRLFLDEDYARSTRFGGLIAPPTYLSTFPPDVLGPVFERDLPFKRMLHTDDIAKIHQPIRPGHLISASARFADVYVKEGRTGPMLFQAADMTLVEADAGLVAVVRVATVHFD